MEYISQIQQIPSPDQYFWYILATVLASSIIYIIHRYVNKTEKLLEKVVDDLQEMRTTTALHAQSIESLQEKTTYDRDQLSDEVANKILSKLRAITPA